VSPEGHKASSEEAFLLMNVKLTKGYTNIELAECFGFSSDHWLHLMADDKFT
jgi:hypothetical protein